MLRASDIWGGFRTTVVVFCRGGGPYKKESCIWVSVLGPRNFGKSSMVQISFFLTPPVVPRPLNLLNYLPLYLVCSIYKLGYPKKG